MGLFSRKSKPAPDAFGATVSASPVEPSAPSVADPVPDVGPLGVLSSFKEWSSGSGVIDARGVEGLREEVTQLALSGGSPDQIMAALREHGIRQEGPSSPTRSTRPSGHGCSRISEPRAGAGRYLNARFLTVSV